MFSGFNMSINCCDMQCMESSLSLSPLKSREMSTEKNEVKSGQLARVATTNDRHSALEGIIGSYMAGFVPQHFNQLFGKMLPGEDPGNEAMYS